MVEEKTYTESEIDSYLKEHLKHWYFENGWIRRKYKTSGWKSTLMVINTVGHLAEAGFPFPLNVLNRGSAVLLAFRTGNARITIRISRCPCSHRAHDGRRREWRAGARAFRRA